jgi:hypothetical protein
MRTSPFGAAMYDQTPQAHKVWVARDFWAICKNFRVFPLILSFVVGLVCVGIAAGLIGHRQAVIYAGGDTGGGAP